LADFLAHYEGDIKETYPSNQTVRAAAGQERGGDSDLVITKILEHG
jgi:hypothetical protein